MPYVRRLRRGFGAVDPSTLSGTQALKDIVTSNAGVDWSKVPWYAVPFVGVDVGVMNAYCALNPSGQGCVPTPPHPVMAGPQTTTEMKVPGAYTPEQQAADTQANYEAAVQDFFNKQAESGNTAVNDCTDNWACCNLGILCGLGIPTWAWWVGGGLLGFAVLKALGGHR